MHYAAFVFKTKKALKEAIANGPIFFEDPSIFSPHPFRTDDLKPGDKFYFVGPGPYDRKWYGSIECRRDGTVKVS